MNKLCVTNNGTYKLAKAAANREKVNIVRFSAGDMGTGIDYSIKDLKHIIYRKALDDNDTFEVLAEEPNALKFSVVIPKGEELTINEVGFYDSETLILYGIINETTKEEDEELELTFYVKFDNTDIENIEISINSRSLDDLLKRLNRLELLFASSDSSTVLDELTDIKSNLTSINKKLENLERYDDTEIKTRLGAIEEEVLGYKQIFERLIG